MGSQVHRVPVCVWIWPDRGPVAHTRCLCAGFQTKETSGVGQTSHSALCQAFGSDAWRVRAMCCVLCLQVTLDRASETLLDACIRVITAFPYFT